MVGVAHRRARVDAYAPDGLMCTHFLPSRRLGEPFGQKRIRGSVVVSDTVGSVGLVAAGLVAIEPR